MSEFSEEKIIEFPRRAEAGIPIKKLGCKHGFSDVSFNRWRSKYSSVDIIEASGCTNWSWRMADSNVRRLGTPRHPRSQDRLWLKAFIERNRL